MSIKRSIVFLIAVIVLAVVVVGIIMATKDMPREYRVICFSAGVIVYDEEIYGEGFSWVERDTGYIVSNFPENCITRRIQ